MPSAGTGWGRAEAVGLGASCKPTLDDDEAVAKMGHPDWRGLSLLQDVLEGVYESGRVVEAGGAEELEA